MDRTEHVVVTPEQTEVTEGKICFRNTHHPVHGALVEYYGNGQKRSEMMLDHGQRSGPYIIWYDTGQKRAEVLLHNGVESGPHTEWYTNGHLRAMTHFRYGIEDGAHMEWHDNSQRAVSALFLSGRLIRVQAWDDHGHALNLPDWNPDGSPKLAVVSPNRPAATPKPPVGKRLQKVRTVYGTHLEKRDPAGRPVASYERGVWHVEDEPQPFTGRAVWNDSEHNLHQEIHFKNGLYDGAWKEFHEGGEKKSEGTYRNGKLEGKATKWWPNGQLQSDVVFKAGRRQGEARSWYHNGQLQSETAFETGRPHGRAIKHHPNGTLVDEREWDNGILVRWRQWDDAGQPLDLSGYGWDAEGNPLP